MNKRFTRRTALKMGLVASFLAACRAGSPRVLPEPPPNPHRYKGEIDTSRGKLIPTIESWPDIRTHEMSWAKERGKAGKLRNTAVIRAPLFSERNDDFIRVRSRIHTHAVLENSLANMRLASIPSPRDIGNIIRLALRERDPQKVIRVQHVIPISFDGKVMGFYTLRIGKKLLELIQNKSPSLEMSIEQILSQNEEKRRFLKNLSTLEALQKKYRDGVVEIDLFIHEYEGLLTELKKDGLQVRVTSKNGYIFKDGFFQKKN